ncbi:MAG: DUF3313 family protein [Nitrospirales bacterium]|nr:DUF3313 family protein [Nitrospirales bacterium]
MAKNSFKKEWFWKRPSWNLNQWGMLFMLGIACLTGCSDTHQARDVHLSGFLGDYSLLQPGGDGEALLTYRNPKADFSKYRKVYVDPIMVWRWTESDSSKVSQEDLQRLANELRSKIIWKLNQDYIMVPSLGPEMMRIQVVLTEATQSNVAMDIFSTLMPGGRLVTGTQQLATGTQAFVGRASIEGKITDSQSGEILLAAVDRRAGGRTLDGSMDSWDDVRQAFEHWAVRLSQKLQQLRTEN